MNTATVTIIGMGPRGLSILERMSHLARGQPKSISLRIHVVDPGECGQGTHDARQPAHLLVNTVASQVTLFPADSETAERGPSLLEWARLAGYRRFGSEYYRAGPGAGTVLSDSDYLPRRLLGEYLTWMYDRVVAALPGNVGLSCHRAVATDLQRVKDGRYAVELENGFIILSDYVFVATGHCRNLPSAEDGAFDRFVRANCKRNPNLAYFRSAYPVESLLKINPGATVAVQGLGLTAHDVISELTVGRGGRFSPEGGAVRYHKSGREPRILLFSRNCMPFAARGVNQKGIQGRHKAQFFTKDAVAQLRAKALETRGTRQLDFDAELLPLLLKEMGYAYRIAKEQRPIAPAEYDLGEEERAVIEQLLYPLREKSFLDLASFRKFVRAHVVADLQDAEKGNVRGPVKAATDVVRDVRDALRLAAEYGGLTPQSHRKFVDEYTPIMNRVAFGPPRARNLELLALWDAGIVEIASGPAPEVSTDAKSGTFRITSRFAGGVESELTADVLIIARVDVFYPERDASPLTRNLLQRGLIRPYRNGTFHPGGIDIDARSHPIARGGDYLENLWAIGYPVEGAHFYTHALPHPFLDSRHVQDAENCVREMFAAVAARAGAPAQVDTTPQQRRAG